MQAADLLKYIEDPQSLDRQSVEQLQKLVRDFPYFQPAHLLLSMASKKWDASVYQQSLKKTAIIAPNRAHLFNLIHQIERAMENREGQKKSEEPYKTAPALEPENATQELNILKAAELVTDTPAKAEKSYAPETKGEEALEKEINKSLVTSFVEKEIIKTPELHKTKASQEPESFVEWLSLLKKNNGLPNPQLGEHQLKPRVKQGETRPDEKISPELPLQKLANNPEIRREKQKALIDKIIENNPGIIRSKEDQKFFSAEIKARESLLESEHLVTETLARIYALQGSVNKAVRAYEILSLKFPQKSAYFATLIQKLKNNP